MNGYATHIGLIDDNDAQRETVKGFLVDALPSGWNVISAQPQPSIRAGLDWIRDNEISVLLLDERLNQTMNTPYSGHELAAAIRGQRPDFPVFVVTSYPDEDDLVVAEKHLDGIVPRRLIGEKPEVYAQRFTRAGLRFAQQHQRDLARLSDLSAKIAKGKASAADTREATALQAVLQLRFFSPDETTTAAAIDELEAAVEEAESLQKQLEAALRKKKKSDAAKKKKR